MKKKKKEHLVIKLPFLELIFFRICSNVSFKVYKWGSCSCFTKLILCNKWLRIAWWSTAKFVFSCHSENILFSFNEFGYRIVVSFMGWGNSNPTNFICGVVFFLQDIVDDFTATIIKWCIPCANDRVFPELIKSKVYRWSRLIYTL